jgi:hypothetical protein
MAKSVEKLVLNIYGLTKNGDVASISVYQKGNSVRLSGSGMAHTPHVLAAGSKDGWVQEARLVWNLTDAYDEHPLFENTERSNERYAALKAKGDEIKRSAEATKKEE